MLFFFRRLKHCFPSFSDRPIYYKKRKFDEIEQVTLDDMETGPPTRRDMQHASTSVKIINLAPYEIVGIANQDICWEFYLHRTGGMEQEEAFRIQ